MENKDMKMDGKMCGCPHHKVMPILVILFGLAFLLGAMNVLPWQFVNMAWPILVIIAGIMKLSRCGCCMGRHM